MVLKGRPFALVLALVASVFFHHEVSADITPVAGVTVFGGAERGTDSKAGGIGGVELFGLAPISPNWGIQGSLGYVGRSDSHRALLSAGPVFGYSSGKVGLFVDFEYKHSDLAHINPALEFLRDRGGQDNYFFFIRGVWTHYFEAFDLLLSYSQPVHKIQNSTALEFDANANPPCFPKHDLTINDLRGVLRFYPTAGTEINVGMLVNSFAGPTRNESKTGVGGILGASWQISGPFIWNIFQGQMDSRSRYLVTSGLQYAWTPAAPASSQTAAAKPLRETAIMARLDSSAVGSGTTSSG
jgi:hypothetical protein